MSEIVSVVARVEVLDLERALPLYRRLSGDAPVERFSFAGIELAWVGPFLLLCGPPDRLEQVRRSATLLVRDIESVARDIREAGGAVLDGPGPAPNGPRMIARHPDGAVFEYIQPAR